MELSNVVLGDWVVIPYPQVVENLSHRGTVREIVLQQRVAVCQIIGLVW
jgi:hypothetical protein